MVSDSNGKKQTIDYPRQFAQEGFPYWAPLGNKMNPGEGASVPRTRMYDMPYLYVDVPSGPPEAPQLSVQQQARQDWEKIYGPLRDRFLKVGAGTPEFHDLAQQYGKALETQPPSPFTAELIRRVERKDRIPQDVQAMLQGMQYGPGPMRGQQYLLPQYQQLGNTRPLGPGEFIDRGNGLYSSEETITVPYQGKWAVLPSLWLVDGQPMTLDEDTAVQLAQQSGLDWPLFASQAQAETFATQREQRWRQLPFGRTDMQPPLWSRPWPPKQLTK